MAGVSYWRVSLKLLPLRCWSCWFRGVVYNCIYFMLMLCVRCIAFLLSLCRSVWFVRIACYSFIYGKGLAKLSMRPRLIKSKMIGLDYKYVMRLSTYIVLIWNQLYNSLLNTRYLVVCISYIWLDWLAQ